MFTPLKNHFNILREKNQRDVTNENKEFMTDGHLALAVTKQIVLLFPWEKSSPFSVNAILKPCSGIPGMISKGFRNSSL